MSSLARASSSSYNSEGLVLWFTGLSGSGKSTLTEALRERLYDEGFDCEVLDGDLVRPYLSQGLGYSREDRLLNCKRIAFVASLLAKQGALVLVPVIAPYEEARQTSRQLIGPAYKEIYVKASLDTVIKRDPKGLYKKALAGEIEQFTGVSDPYEAPEQPDLVLDTDNAKNPEALLEELWAWGEHLGFWTSYSPALTA